MSNLGSLSRRSMLKVGVGTMLPLMAGCSTLPRADGEDFGNPVEADRVWEQLLWMNGLGPRLTGNSAHLTFVDFIAAELESMGLRVGREVQPFTRWEARRSSIVAVDVSGRERSLPVASEYPYSAPTGSAGISAPLVYGGAVGDELPGLDLRDAIVYLDCPVPPLEFGSYYADEQPYGSLRQFPQQVTQASGQIVSAPNLETFAQRGARAVILGWTNVSEEQARDQYIPFNRPEQPVPGLWVGPGAAKELRLLGMERAPIRLTLEADLDTNAESRSLYALVPGASDELVIVTTHTDGPNAVEENGPLAMLAMARRQLRQDISSRRRSVLYLFPSGHFVGPTAKSTEHLLEVHPEFVQRAVAGLAVEHLGCIEWQDNADGVYAATGEAETSLIFAHGDGMSSIASAAARMSHDRRGAVVRPRDLGHFFGEGRALARAGIPSIGFLPAPSYLLAKGRRGHIDKVDRDLFNAQIALCQDMLDRLVKEDLPA